MSDRRQPHSAKLEEGKMAATLLKRKKRANPEVIEEMLDNQEEKVRHYFLLFKNEKARFNKSQQYNFWLQHELKEQQLEKENCEKQLRSLERQLREIKGDPNTLRDQLQRLDLIYLQLDSLVQSLAGICNKVVFEELGRSDLIQVALDYLYPCRGLDSRLNVLYGWIYYHRLGKTETVPSAPLPPPEPRYIAKGEAQFPWIPPATPRKTEPHTTHPIPQTHFDKVLGETLEILPKAEAPKTVEKSKPAASGATPNFLKRGDAGTANKAISADPNVLLEGFKMLVNRIEGFNRPKSSTTKTLACLMRFDNEDSKEVVKNGTRKTKTATCQTIVGKEAARFNEVLNVSDLPPKAAGVIPSFIIEVYDEEPSKGTLLGSATMPFVDETTLKPQQEWVIKGTEGVAIGKVIIGITPKPENAMMPALRLKNEAPSGSTTVVGRNSISIKAAKEPEKDDATAKNGKAYTSAAKQTIQTPKPSEGNVTVAGKANLEAPGIAIEKAKSESKEGRVSPKVYSKSPNLKDSGPSHPASNLEDEKQPEGLVSKSAGLVSKSGVTKLAPDAPKEDRDQPKSADTLGSESAGKAPDEANDFPAKKKFTIKKPLMLQKPGAKKEATVSQLAPPLGDAAASEQSTSAGPPQAGFKETSTRKSPSGSGSGTPRGGPKLESPAGDSKDVKTVMGKAIAMSPKATEASPTGSKDAAAQQPQDLPVPAKKVPLLSVTKASSVQEPKLTSPASKSPTSAMGETKGSTLGAKGIAKGSEPARLSSTEKSSSPRLPLTSNADSPVIKKIQIKKPALSPQIKKPLLDASKNRLPPLKIQGVNESAPVIIGKEASKPEAELEAPKLSKEVKAPKLALKKPSAPLKKTPEHLTPPTAPDDLPSATPFTEISEKIPPKKGTTPSKVAGKDATGKVMKKTKKVIVKK